MIEEWTDFFVAAAGAGAALAGLIIVAMSVNIKTILSISGMTSRAAATIGAMVLIVLMSLAALMPAQALRSFGIETICFALLASSFAAHSGYQMVRHPPRGAMGGAWVRTAIAVGQLVPFLIGGALLIAGVDSGTYWIAAGILAVFIASVTNTWVLLVEILR